MPNSKQIQNSTEFTFFNITPSPRDDRDVTIEMIIEPPYKYPRTCDWTKYLKDVRNQGIQGTSLTQVGACIFEWKERKINKNSIRFSPQYLYNCRKEKNEVLMCGRDLMKLMMKNGCCTEQWCPYGKYLTNTPEMNHDANKYKIKGYIKIQTIETLKVALHVFGPCVLTFPVYNHTSYMWKRHFAEEKLGGHAMTIIGYNATGFILRNSWGKYWENTGHCIFPFDDWGLHYEAWCAADRETYSKWTQKHENVMVKCMEKMVEKGKSIGMKYVKDMMEQGRAGEDVDHQENRDDNYTNYDQNETVNYTSSNRRSNDTYRPQSDE